MEFLWQPHQRPGLKRLRGADSRGPATVLQRSARRQWLWLALTLVVAALTAGCGDEVVQSGSRDVSLLGAQDLATVELPAPVSGTGDPYACPGGYGCACAADAECTGSKLCLMESEGGAGSCAVPCPTGLCAGGLACRSVTGHQGEFCVTKTARLCDPCAVDSDCQVPGHAGAVCVNYGSLGRFCGVACTGDADCGAGHSCRLLASASGAAVQQCVKQGSPGPAGQFTLGECACSPRATAAKLSTVCGVGSCLGSRACSDQGLSPCSGAQPGAEVCNGQDDDCDGQTDETSCNDNNPCTTDSCAPATGCSHAATAAGACSDGDACTQGDSCADGKCKAGTAVTCDDGNACSTDACDPGQGCQYSWPLKPCDDGNVCTSGDSCKDGKCKGGAAKICDDSNPCTADVCEKSLPGGCTATAVDGAPCSDGDACTGADTCGGGKCAGSSLSCDDNNPCTADSCESAQGCVNLAVPTTPCDDGNACTSDEQCAQGKCSGGKAKVCTTENPCLTAACLATTGQCGLKVRPNGSTCSDGQACSTGDSCKQGVCSGALSCDDKDACTADFCGITGNCAHSPVLIGDCQPAACKTLDCDDKNPCTQDGCDAKGCSHVALVGSSCDDASICTAGDICQPNGKCSGGKVSCDDAEPCTTDTCDPIKGCEHGVFTGPCSLAGCKVGVCSSGQCQDSGKTGCDDSNPCTKDSCVSGDCQFKADDTLACDDGSKCTTGDACKAGLCQAAAVDCDDKNPCTSHSCDKATGCATVNLSDGATCTDSDACTDSEACKAGNCASKTKDCSDDNSCTADSCDPKTGCAHSPLDAASCEDGNACTEGDTCAKGSCIGAKTVVCVDDENPCTKQACAPSSGCTATADDTSGCTDGDPCTSQDSCSGGVCKGSVPPDEVQLIAGNGTQGFKDAKGDLAQFTQPIAVTRGVTGVLYVADAAEGGARIRKIASDGTVTTLAGQGLSGFADGGPTQAKFWNPTGIVVDGSGNVYVADRFNQRIRQVASNGTVTTLAGSAPDPDFLDPKAEGAYVDGKGTAARFDEPAGLALGGGGALYVVEAANQRVRIVLADGTVTTAAGDGSTGSKDGPAAEASFNGPTAVAVGSDGAVYIADTGNHRIRKLDKGTVSTVFGSTAGFANGDAASAKLSSPMGLAVNSAGDLFIADSGNHALRKFSGGQVSTLAGTTVAGFAGGTFDKAQFKGPGGLWLSGPGSWYVADTANFRIRRAYSPLLACPPKP